MKDWTDQPEAGGPLLASDSASFTEPGPVSGPPQPATDPALAAIKRCCAAEARADFGKTAPADALDLRP